MPRFFIEKEAVKDNVAEIVGEDARNISRVLRLGIGDNVILFDEDGLEYHCVIRQRNSKRLKVEIIQKVYLQRESSVEIILGQGLPKLHKMDIIVQKSTELGIHELVPFHAHRSMPKLDRERLIKKVERWRKIALEATKQCGRNIIPHIEYPIDFKEIIKNEEATDGLKLFLWEGDGTIDLREILQANSDKKRFIVLVGPEGGFTDKEVQDANEHGFKTASMGSRILRSETASISIVSIIQYMFGDLH
ncbi:MAG: 16S rRNA (uracil(1498)-N(3))-methyltransferase [Thermodesulfobacteriota bacterium]|nr:16S rRNA (uracil(1498)-N(3))-methyltransferase [Thermodesulfobacteriota bacterium]